MIDSLLEDFLENSLSGYISTNPHGEITRVNAKITEWLGLDRKALIGKRITSILAVGSRIFYETHLSPLLKLKGFFEEVSAEVLLLDGNKMQVLMNGYARNDENGKPQVIELNIYRATERKVYEDNLRHTITDTENSLKSEREIAILREQFIAVLGHDLRNPLGAIKSGSSLLGRSALSDRDKSIVGTIAKSSLRMEEMIANVMDFARVRMGGGMVLRLETVLLEPVITHIVNELKISFQERDIFTDLDVKLPLTCDANRISQMLSNLLANALTHGSVEKQVSISAKILNNFLEITVRNSGRAIPADVLQTLFEPFTREGKTPSQQGLGLGLYIASQIAIAHGGHLTVASDSKETCFQFRMSLTN